MADEQPDPKPGGDSVTDFAVAFLHRRRELGISRYGQELLTDDGRDTLLDWYEEQADAFKYATKFFLENWKGGNG